MATPLPIGYKLQFNNRPGEYTVLKVIGRGASTIAYLTSYDNGTGKSSDRIIKEFCPQSIPIERNCSGVLLVDAKFQDEFARSLRLFVAGGDRQNELRNRTRLQNETPPMLETFHANQTAYLEVTPFEGLTYDHLESFTLLERAKICLTIAKLVHQYHSEGYLCLDIKPDNVFILTNSANEVVTDLVEFIDFDSVRKKSEISFGNSLSFTKAWAAPEQISTHGVRHISEATDVYTVGELVFWSIFERHSSEDEHRSFSNYPFETVPVPFAGLLSRSRVQATLAKLFQKTLRSSVRNRYQTMQPVIDILSELCEMLSEKEYIIAAEVRANEFFVGRSNEYDELSARLEAEHLIFLCGIGGIGKSELAKQYAVRNKQKYGNILYFPYTGNFEDTICQDHITVATVERVDDESNHHFCWRKLHAIKRCLHGTSLMIIDNLNSRLEDIEDQSVWEFLLSLPCEIIVTTRAEQTQHMLRISEFEDTKPLKSIYSHYCPYEAEQEPFVDEIIQRLNCHTLLTELLAKQTRAAMHTPKEILALLESNGIHGLDKETVGMRKDNHLSRETVFHHTRTLFAMSSMTLEQQLTMTKASFMPESGVAAQDFLNYHAIENKNDINWLVDNGWLYRFADSSFTLSIHPIIAEIVLENAKANQELLQIFYDGAMKSLPWKLKVISQEAHEKLCNAIASVTIKDNIRTRPAAVYLIRHAAHPAVRSNHVANMEQLKTAISILESDVSESQYCAILEYAHLCYIQLATEPSNLDSSIYTCKKHLSRAKKAKDLFLTAKFYHQLSRFSTERINSQSGGLADIGKMLYYYYASIFYWSRLESDVKRKSPRYTSTNRLKNDLDYDYLADSVSKVGINFRLEIAADLENMNAGILFCSKLSASEVQNLKKALHFRRYLVHDRILRPTHNSVEIVIDEARILYHQGDFDGAKKELLSVVEMYNTKRLLADSSLCRVHQFLGNIAAITGDFNTAVIELKRCLEIGEELHIKGGFLAKIQLGRFLNEAGNIIESERLNTEVLSIVEQLDVDTRKSYYGDALYNYASLQFLKGDPNGAIKTYIKAYNEYCQCTGAPEFSMIGRARCCRKLSEIYYKYGKMEKAEQEFTLAREKYIDCLGENHPEVLEFLLQSPTK